MNSRFFIPIDVRWAAWRQAGQFLGLPYQKVLIATSRSSLIRAEELQKDILADHRTELLPVISADPTITSVQEFTDGVIAATPDWIIAIGGGSVLDTAKAGAVAANNGGDVASLIRGTRLIDRPGIPLIAIPTTSGSGSEVTPYASITDATESKKISLSHDFLFPRFALLDPSLTLSLSLRQTAISGMDALCHAIEGYWSNRATPATDALALSAARLLLDQLPETQRAPDNLNARRQTMEGSMLAGLTISNARTTAVHAISYPITVSFGVPHGLACSLTLPSMMRFNAGAMAGEKEYQLLHHLGAKSMGHLADTVEQLQTELELPIKLSGVGIGPGEISKIVENGYRPDRMSNNPREISADQLTLLLENLI